MHVNTLYPIVHADVHFTRLEIHQLLDLSKKHYDGRCKAASQHGGILYGWNNRLGNEAGVDIDVEWKQLDLLCKIAEMENGCAMLGSMPLRGDLGTKLHGVIQQMRDRADVLCAYNDGLST